MVNAWGESASLEFMNVESFTQYERHMSGSCTKKHHLTAKIR